MEIHFKIYFIAVAVQKYMNIRCRFQLSRDYPSFSRSLPNVGNNYVVQFLPWPLPQQDNFLLPWLGLAWTRVQGVVVMSEIEPSKYSRQNDGSDFHRFEMFADGQSQ